MDTLRSIEKLERVFCTGFHYPDRKVFQQNWRSSERSEGDQRKLEFVVVGSTGLRLIKDPSSSPI